MPNKDEQENKLNPMDFTPANLGLSTNLEQAQQQTAQAIQEQRQAEDAAAAAGIQEYIDKVEKRHAQEVEGLTEAMKARTDMSPATYTVNTLENSPYTSSVLNGEKEEKYTSERAEDIETNIKRQNKTFARDNKAWADTEGTTGSKRNEVDENGTYHWKGYADEDGNWVSGLSEWAQDNQARINSEIDAYNSNDGKTFLTEDEIQAHQQEVANLYYDCGELEEYTQKVVDDLKAKYSTATDDEKKEIDAQLEVYEYNLGVYKGWQDTAKNIYDGWSSRNDYFDSMDDNKKKNVNDPALYKEYGGDTPENIQRVIDNYKDAINQKKANVDASVGYVTDPSMQDDITNQRNEIKQYEQRVTELERNLKTAQDRRTELERQNSDLELRRKYAMILGKNENGGDELHTPQTADWKSLSVDLNEKLSSAINNGNEAEAAILTNEIRFVDSQYENYTKYDLQQKYLDASDKDLNDRIAELSPSEAKAGEEVKTEKKEATVPTRTAADIRDEMAQLHPEKDKDKYNSLMNELNNLGNPSESVAAVETVKEEPVEEKELTAAEQWELDILLQERERREMDALFQKEYVAKYGDQASLKWLEDATAKYDSAYQDFITTASPQAAAFGVFDPQLSYDIQKSIEAEHAKAAERLEAADHERTYALIQYNLTKAADPNLAKDAAKGRASAPQLADLQKAFDTITNPDFDLSDTEGRKNKGVLAGLGITGDDADSLIYMLNSVGVNANDFIPRTDKTTEGEQATHSYALGETARKWTKEEEDIYYSLWANEGAAAAAKYAFEVNSVVGREYHDQVLRNMMDVKLFEAKNRKGEFATEALFAPWITNPLNITALADFAATTSQVGRIGTAMTSPTKFTLNELGNMINTVNSSVISETSKYPELASLLYNSYTSAVGSVETAALGGMVGSAISSALGLGSEAIIFGDSAADAIARGYTSLAFFGSAAASSYDEFIKRGVEPTKAWGASLASGLAEAFFEDFSFDKVYDAIKTGHVFDTFPAFAANLLASSGIEASEEVFTEIANFATENLILKQDSSFWIAVNNYHDYNGLSYPEALKQALKDEAKEIGIAAASAILSTGGSVGVPSYISYSEFQKQTKQQAKTFGERITNGSNDAKALGKKLGEFYSTFELIKDGEDRLTKGQKKDLETLHQLADKAKNGAASAEELGQLKLLAKRLDEETFFDFVRANKESWSAISNGDASAAMIDGLMLLIGEENVDAFIQSSLENPDVVIEDDFVSGLRQAVAGISHEDALKAENALGLVVAGSKNHNEAQIRSALKEAFKTDAARTYALNYIADKVQRFNAPKSGVRYILSRNGAQETTQPWIYTTNNSTVTSDFEQTMVNVWSGVQKANELLNLANQMRAQEAYNASVSRSAEEAIQNGKPVSDGIENFRDDSDTITLFGKEYVRKDFLESIGKGINPITGESFRNGTPTQEQANTFFDNVLRNNTRQDALSGFIDVGARMKNYDAWQKSLASQNNTTGEETNGRSGVRTGENARRDETQSQRGTSGTVGQHVSGGVGTAQPVRTEGHGGNQESAQEVDIGAVTKNGKQKIKHTLKGEITIDTGNMTLEEVEAREDIPQELKDVILKAMDAGISRVVIARGEMVNALGITVDGYSGYTKVDGKVVPTVVIANNGNTTANIVTLRHETLHYFVSQMDDKTKRAFFNAILETVFAGRSELYEKIFEAYTKQAYGRAYGGNRIKNDVVTLDKDLIADIDEEIVADLYGGSIRWARYANDPDIRAFYTDAYFKVNRLFNDLGILDYAKSKQNKTERSSKGRFDISEFKGTVKTAFGKRLAGRQIELPYSEDTLNELMKVFRKDIQSLSDEDFESLKQRVNASNSSEIRQRQLNERAIIEIIAEDERRVKLREEAAKKAAEKKEEPKKEPKKKGTKKGKTTQQTQTTERTATNNMNAETEEDFDAILNTLTKLKDRESFYFNYKGRQFVITVDESRDAGSFYRIGMTTNGQLWKATNLSQAATAKEALDFIRNRMGQPQSTTTEATQETQEAEEQPEAKAEEPKKKRGRKKKETPAAETATEATEETTEAKAEETPAEETKTEEPKAEEKPQEKKKRGRKKKEAPVEEKAEEKVEPEQVTDIPADPNRKYTEEDIVNEIPLTTAAPIAKGFKRTMPISERSWDDTIKNDAGEDVERAVFVARMMNGYRGEDGNFKLMNRLSAGAAMNMFDNTFYKQNGKGGKLSIAPKTVDEIMYELQYGTDEFVTETNTPENEQPEIFNIAGDPELEGKYSIATDTLRSPKQEIYVADSGVTKVTRMDNGGLYFASVRELRDQRLRENEWFMNTLGEEYITELNEFLDDLASEIEKAGEEFHYLGLEDLLNATLTIDPVTNRLNLTAMVPNSEYELNFDFSTICERRQALQQIVDELLANATYDDTGAASIKLNADTIMKMNKELQKLGVNTQCLICFVETKRFNQAEGYLNITTAWNNAVKRKVENPESFNFMNGAEQLTPDRIENRRRALEGFSLGGSIEEVVNNLVDRLAMYSPEDLKMINIGDIVNSKGRTNLSTSFPALDDILKKKGQAAPKAVYGFTPYNGEIESMEYTGSKFNSLQDYVASIGGVRSQSFSDFIISHVFDHLQKTAALAAMNLPAHTYTKVYARAVLFGMTGEKINMSILCGLDRDINSWYSGLNQEVNAWDFNSTWNVTGAEARNRPYLLADAKAYKNGEVPYIQSFPWDESVELEMRDGYVGNVGPIVVGLSYWHNMLLQQDPYVAMVIGYHSSQMPTNVKKEMGVSRAADYTKVQNNLKFNTATENNGVQHTGIAIPNYNILPGVPSYATKPQSVGKRKGAQNLTTVARFEDYPELNDLLAGGNISQAFTNYQEAHSDLSRSEAANAMMLEILNKMNQYGLVFDTKKAEQGHGNFDLYADFAETDNAYDTADNYVAYCFEHDEIPMFYEFFTDPNYFKRIFDFQVVDPTSYNVETGRYERFAQQKPVRLFDENGELLLPGGRYGFKGEVYDFLKSYNDQQKQVYELLHNDGFMDTMETIVGGKLSIAPQNENDEAYVDAIRNDHMTKAQTVVDKEARKKGYKKHLYHGTQKYGFNEFWEVSRHEFGVHLGTEQAARHFYDTALLKKDGIWGDELGVYDVYAKMENTLRLPDEFGRYDALRTIVDNVGYWAEEGYWGTQKKMTRKDFAKLQTILVNNEDYQAYLDAVEEAEDLEVAYNQSWGQERADLEEEFNEAAREANQMARQYLLNLGYDSVVYNNKIEDAGNDSYIILKPENIKSAEVVTEDQRGNIILPSQRFDDSTRDIRYSIVNIKSDTKDYGLGVLFDSSDFSEQEESWAGRAGELVEHFAGHPFAAHDIDTDEVVTLKIAASSARHRKSTHTQSTRVIDELKTNANDANRGVATNKARFVLHLPEIVEVMRSNHSFSRPQGPTHGWLDRKGWRYYRVYGMDIDGNIYTAFINVAQGDLGDTLYTITAYPNPIDKLSNFHGELKNESLGAEKPATDEPSGDATSKDSADIIPQSDEESKLENVNTEELPGEDKVDAIDEKYSIAGPKAANADLGKLKQALDMELNREDDLSIWQKTGWFRGVDGKWRWEIYDKNFKLDLNTLRFEKSKALYDESTLDADPNATIMDNVYYLGDVLQGADKLFENYPDLEDITLIFSDLQDDDLYGEFDPDTNEIYINSRLLKGLSLYQAAKEIRSTLMHEIQHSIQTIEGFAEGSNSEEWEDRRQNGNGRVIIENPNTRANKVVDSYESNMSENEVSLWRNLYNAMDAALHFPNKLNTIGLRGMTLDQISALIEQYNESGLNPEFEVIRPDEVISRGRTLINELYREIDEYINGYGADTNDANVKKVRNALKKYTGKDLTAKELNNVYNLLTTKYADTLEALFGFDIIAYNEFDFDNYLLPAYNTQTNIENGVITDPSVRMITSYDTNDPVDMDTFAREFEQMARIYNAQVDEGNTYDARLQNLKRYFDGVNIAEYLNARKTIAEVEERLDEGESGDELYYDTAGEIEARDVQARLDMTKAERRDQIPFRPHWAIFNSVDASGEAQNKSSEDIVRDIDAKYSIVGKKAKYANYGSLREAMKMEVDGATEDDIWDKTGWYRGAEGFISSYTGEVLDNVEEAIKHATYVAENKGYDPENLQYEWESYLNGKSVLKAYYQKPGSSITIPIVTFEQYKPAVENDLEETTPESGNKIEPSESMDLFEFYDWIDTLDPAVTSVLDRVEFKVQHYHDNDFPADNFGVISSNGDKYDDIYSAYIASVVRAYKLGCDLETFRVEKYDIEGKENYFFYATFPNSGVEKAINSFTRSEEDFSELEDDTLDILEDLSEPTNGEVKPIQKSTPKIDEKTGDPIMVDSYTGEVLNHDKSIFFKDSGARTQNGEFLLRLFHGTDAYGFTIWDPQYSDDKRSLFFTDNEDVARSYIRRNRNAEVTSIFDYEAKKANRKLVKDMSIEELLNVMNETDNKYNMSTRYFGTFADYKKFLPMELQSAIYKLEQAGKAYTGTDNVPGPVSKMLDIMRKALDNLDAYTDNDQSRLSAYAMDVITLLPYKVVSSTEGTPSLNRVAGYADTVMRELRNIKNLPKPDDTKLFFRQEYGLLDWTLYTEDDIRESVRYELGEDEDDNSHSAIYPVYCNIKNPYILDANFNEWTEIPTPRELNEYIDNLTDDEAQYYTSYFGANYMKTRGIAKYAMDHGYDGVVIYNVRDIGSSGYWGEGSGYSTVVIAFYPEQVKDVNNEHPTNNIDMKFSITDPVDLFGNELPDLAGTRVSATRSDLSETLYYSYDGNTAYYITPEGRTVVIDNIGEDSPEAQYIKYLEATNNANNVNTTTTEPYSIPSRSRYEANGYNLGEQSTGLRRGTEEIPAQDQEGTLRRGGSVSELYGQSRPQSQEEESVNGKFSISVSDVFENEKGDPDRYLWDDNGNVITTASAYPLESIERFFFDAMNRQDFSDIEKVIQEAVDAGYSVGEDELSLLDQMINENREATPEQKEALKKAAEEAVKKYGTLKQKGTKGYEHTIPAKTKVNGETRNTRSFVGTAASNTNEELNDALTNEVMTREIYGYTPQSNPETLRKAKEILRTQYNGNLDKAINHIADLVESGQMPTAADIALGEILITELSSDVSDENRMNKAVKVTADLAVLGTNLGQAVQAMSMIRKMTPRGQLYYLQGVVKQLNRQFANRFDEIKHPPVKINDALAMQLLAATNREEMDKAMELIKDDLARQVPVTIADKWNAWRYLAMLGNPRTHFRNIFGNAVFMPAVFIKDMVARGLAQNTNWVDPSARTMGDADLSGWFSGKEGSNPYVNFALKDFRLMENVAKGKKVGNKYADINDILSRRKIFGFGPLDWLNEKNSTFLENQDLWFMQRYYVRYMAEFLQEKGIKAEDLNKFAANPEGKALLNQARSWAMQQAHRNTYHEMNTWAMALNKLKHSSGAAYTLMDGVIPFVGTPANILKLALVNYSPYGLIKSGVELKRALDNGDKQSTMKILDGLASGLTGTGIMILGALLARFGLFGFKLRGAGPDDDKEAQFERLMGHQQWSIEGHGISYTLDWAAPMSLPLFTGATFYELFSREHPFANPDELWAALMGLANPMLSMSMLDGLETTLSALTYSEEGSRISALLGAALTSHVAQAFPTFTGQVNRIIDPTQRTNYVDKNSKIPGALQKFVQQNVYSKVPGLSFLKNEYVDEWGRTNTSTNLIGRVFANFVSPGYFKFINETPVDTELMRLSNALDDNSVLPGWAAKSVGKQDIGKDDNGNVITIDGRDFTGKEYEKYAKVVGQNRYALLSGLFATAEYQSATDTEKAKMVNDAYEYARSLGRQAIIPERKMDSSWMETAKKVGAVDYIAMRQEYENNKNNDRIYTWMVNNPNLSTDQMAVLFADKLNTPEYINSNDITGYRYKTLNSDDELLHAMYEVALQEALPGLYNSKAFINADEDEKADQLRLFVEDVKAQTLSNYSDYLSTTDRALSIGKSSSLTQDTKFEVMLDAYDGDHRAQAEWIARDYKPSKTMANPDHKGYTLEVPAEDLQKSGWMYEQVMSRYQDAYDKLWTGSDQLSKRFQDAAKRNNKQEMALISERVYKETVAKVEEEYASTLAKSGRATEVFMETPTGYDEIDAYEIAVERYGNDLNAIGEYIAKTIDNHTTIEDPDNPGFVIVLDDAQQIQGKKDRDKMFATLFAEEASKDYFKNATLDQKKEYLKGFVHAVDAEYQSQYAKKIKAAGYNEITTALNGNNTSVDEFLGHMEKNNYSKEETVEIMMARYKVDHTLNQVNYNPAARVLQIEAAKKYYEDNYEAVKSGAMTWKQYRDNASKAANSAATGNFGVRAVGKIPAPEYNTPTIDPNFASNVSTVTPPTKSSTGTVISPTNFWANLIRR